MFSEILKPKDEGNRMNRNYCKAYFSQRVKKEEVDLLERHLIKHITPFLISMASKSNSRDFATFRKLHGS